MEGLPLGTQGGKLRVTYTFPADGEYVFYGRLLRTVAEGYVGVEGHETPHQFVIMVDGQEVHSGSGRRQGRPRDEFQGHPLRRRLMSTSA